MVPCVQPPLLSRPQGSGIRQEEHERAADCAWRVYRLSLIHIFGGALGTEVFKDEEVWGEDSLKVPGTLLEGGFHQVHDLLDIGHETGEPALDDGVRDAGRMEALARAALPVQDKPLRVFRVEGRGKCLADGALSRVPAVIGIEGAEGVPAG